MAAPILAASAGTVCGLTSASGPGLRTRSARMWSTTLALQVVFVTILAASEGITGDKHVLVQWAASGATRRCWEPRCRTGSVTERCSKIFSAWPSWRNRAVVLS
jgi:hypothetical protein